MYSCQNLTSHWATVLYLHPINSYRYISCWILIKWAPSSEFVSLSIPSWQILTVHAQPFRGARDLAFCLKVPLDSLLVWASSEGSGKTARMRRLAWTFAARIGNKYQIRLTRSKLLSLHRTGEVKIVNVLTNLGIAVLSKYLRSCLRQMLT